MRQGPNGRRSRNRHHGGGQHNQNPQSGGGNQQTISSNRPRSAASLRHQNFDSNCIDVRVRGNAWQVHEKYLALARDAQGSGDRISAENFFQHAEHYFRIIEAINEATSQEQKQRASSQSFSQQPDIPSGYYENPQSAQAASVSMRGTSPDLHSAQVLHGDNASKVSHSSAEQLQAGEFVNQGIPAALSDPFFGSEDSDVVQQVDQAAQR